MQTHTIMGHQFIPTAMAIIKKTEGTYCQGCQNCTFVCYSVSKNVSILFC
jgi:hypothetical protein